MKNEKETNFDEQADSDSHQKPKSGGSQTRRECHVSKALLSDLNVCEKIRHRNAPSEYRQTHRRFRYLEDCTNKLRKINSIKKSKKKKKENEMKNMKNS